MLALLLLLTSTRCDSGSTITERGHALTSERRVASRSWSKARTVDVGLGPLRPGSNIQALSGYGRGAHLALGVFGDQEHISIDPHRLVVLDYRDNSWSMLVQLEEDVPFNTASVSVDDKDQPVVFWVGDPTGETDESALRAGLFAQPATTLYACRISGQMCEQTDSLNFGRQVRARIQDVIQFDGSVMLSLLEMPFLTHLIAHESAGLRQADYLVGRIGKMTNIDSHLMLTGIDPKKNSSSGFRIFSSQWNGIELEASVSVFEKNPDSAIDISKPEIDFDGNIHVAFLATGDGREKVYDIHSTDGGASWSEATLLREQAPFVMDPLSVLTDEAGVLHTIMGSATGVGQFEWHQRTLFRGTWSDLEPFPPTVGMSPRAVHLTRMGDGRLMAVWRNDDEVHYSIYE